MNNENQVESVKGQDEIKFDAGTNLKALFAYFLAHWHWFLISILASFVLAFIYLRYQVPIYQASSTVLIKGDKKGTGASELDAFSDVELLSKSSSIENEMEIFKSRTLMNKVVNDLNLQISYVAKGKIISKEIYKGSPVRLFLLDNEKRETIRGTISVNILNNKEFELLDGGSEIPVKHKFKDTITTSIGEAVVTPFATDLKPWINKPIIINKGTLNSVVQKYQRALTVRPVNKVSSTVILTISDPSKEKAEDIINNLVFQHNQDAIEDKNQISKNTANFINERLQFITSELTSVESSEQGFKQRNNIVDLEAQSRMYLASDQVNDQRIHEANMQMKAADHVFNFIQRSNNTDLIPTNLGLNDGPSAGMINNYNTILIDRNRILQNSTEINPMVESYDLQLQSLKSSIISSISNYRTSLQIQMNGMASQAGAFNSKIYSAPSYQRQFKSIDRQQQIKEALYIYLLQKREETNIALAVTVSNTKTIDAAFSDGGAISPNKSNLYSLALTLGLLLPAFLLYLKTVLDTKVHSYKDLETLNIPFIGDIPFTEFTNNLVVSKGVSTNIAESFRMVRTNMDFMMNKFTQGGKMVLITSTLPNEGKSFISLNLASTIALADKKVILVGLDLRMPKLLSYLELPDHIGITNYIKDPTLTLKDIIIKNKVAGNIDVLASGDIPPNPSELLLHERITELFEGLKKQYDYIIVDTAPVGMVTDTLLVNNFADSCIYVVRANFLEKNMIGIPYALHNENRLTNMAVLLNGTHEKKGGGYNYSYGYGQGYHYGYGHSYGNYGKTEAEKKSIWKRLFGRG